MVARSPLPRPQPFRKLPRGRLYFQPLHAIATALRPGLRRGAPADPIARLRQALATTLDSRHAVLVGHCRVALYHTLRALDLPPGTRVAMTPLTVPGVVDAVHLAGLQPLWVDLGEQTANMDPQDLRRRLTPQTRVLLVTHLCGLPADLPALQQIARENHLILLEDASQAMGARLHGRQVGTWGRAAVFSLSTMKPVSSFHGGLLLTDDAALADAVWKDSESQTIDRPPWHALTWLGRDLAMHGATHPALFSRLTWPILTAAERLMPAAVDEFQRGNVLLLPRRRAMARPVTQVPRDWRHRFSSWQAQLALPLLTELPEGNRRRRDLGVRLRERLAAFGVSGVARVLPAAEPTYWRFPLWTQDPQRLRRDLHEAGIDSGHSNLTACHRVWPGDRPTTLPHADAYADRMVFLPMHPDLRRADMDRIAEAVYRSEARA